MAEVLGAVIRDFYKNHWPEGFWHEEGEIPIEDDYGNWILPDDARVDPEKLGWLADESKNGQFAMSFADALAQHLGLCPETEVVVFRTSPEMAQKLRDFAQTIGVSPA